MNLSKIFFDFFNSDFQQMMEDLQAIRISLKDKRLRDILNRLYGGQQSAYSGRNTHENALPSFGIHFLSFYINSCRSPNFRCVLAKPHFLSFYIFNIYIVGSVIVLAKPHFLSFYITSELSNANNHVLAKPHFLSFYIKWYSTAWTGKFWRNLIS